MGDWLGLHRWGGEGGGGGLGVESVAGHLLPPGSVFAFLAEHRRVVPDEMFADLFVPAGPAVDPGGGGGLGDRVADPARLVGSRGRRRRSRSICGGRRRVGSRSTAAGFHPTALTYWRRRLAASERPQRIFDAVREVIAETGVLAGKTRRALDSTVLDDAVATQDTVTQLIAAIRRVGRDVPGAAEVIAELPVHRARLHRAGQAADRLGRRGRPGRAGRRAGGRRARPARRAMSPRSRTRAGRPAEAVALLALVAGQDVEPAEGSDGTDGRWRIARKRRRTG